MGKTDDTPPGLLKQPTKNGWLIFAWGPEQVITIDGLTTVSVHPDLLNSVRVVDFNQPRSFGIIGSVALHVEITPIIGKHAYIQPITRDILNDWADEIKGADQGFALHNVVQAAYSLVIAKQQAEKIAQIKDGTG